MALTSPDSRSGQSLSTSVAATVVASDAVTANALATTLCLTSADYGLQLVESTPGAEAIAGRLGCLATNVRLCPSGTAVSRANARDTQVASRIPRHDHSSAHDRRVPRNVLMWPCGWRTLQTSWFAFSRSGLANRSTTRICRRCGPPSRKLPSISIRHARHAVAGKYDLVWDGLDNDHKPVPLGEYRITVETNQENGTYAKQTGTIRLGDSPTSITLPATTNFDAVTRAVRSHVEP